MPSIGNSTPCWPAPPPCQHIALLPACSTAWAIAGSNAPQANLLLLRQPPADTRPNSADPSRKLACANTATNANSPMECVNCATYSVILSTRRSYVALSTQLGSVHTGHAATSCTMRKRRGDANQPPLVVPWRPCRLAAPWLRT